MVDLTKLYQMTLEIEKKAHNALYIYCTNHGINFDDLDDVEKFSLLLSLYLLGELTDEKIVR